MPPPLVSHRHFHPSRRRFQDDESKPPPQTPASTSGATPTEPSAPSEPSNENAPSTEKIRLRKSSPEVRPEAPTDADVDDEERDVLQQAIGQVDQEDARGAEDSPAASESRLSDGEQDSLTSLVEGLDEDGTRDELDEASDTEDTPSTPEEYAAFVAGLDPEGKRHLATLESQLYRVQSEAVRDFNEELGRVGPLPDLPPKRERPGLLAMGDDDEIEQGDDEIFEGDDITSLGHKDLERHREMREYARIIAWDMPLLSSLFSMPKAFLQAALLRGKSI